MNREHWEEWKAAPSGPRKKHLLSRLLEDNQALVQAYVTSFVKRTSYYTGNLREDLVQAASIGFIRACHAWRPNKGAFSNCAFFWTLKEMQKVVRHATNLSVPMDAFLPPSKQKEQAAFYALHGRDPEAHEVGITPRALDLHRKALIACVPLEKQDIERAQEATDPEESPEANIDRGRDQAALSEYLSSLSRRAQREFWAGTRPELVQQAKRFVEARRIRRKTDEGPQR